MVKFWDKISSLEKVSYKELAENLYEVLVLDGGPTSPDVGQEPRLNAVTLGIPADKMEREADLRRVAVAGGGSGHRRADRTATKGLGGSRTAPAGHGDRDIRTENVA